MLIFYIANNLLNYLKNYNLLIVNHILIKFLFLIIQDYILYLEVIVHCLQIEVSNKTCSNLL